MCYNPHVMKATLIHNPTAGPWDAQRALKHICSFLEDRGWSVALHLTEKSGDATMLAREAANAGCDVAIVAGGDGTVNEVVNGLVGTETAMAVLPVGTGNVWAKQLNIPTHTLTHPFRLQETAAGLVEGTIRAVDVGQVNDRYFLCWAGIGLDAKVTTEMEPRQRHTKRLGALPYAIAAVLIARDFKGVRARVLLDGKAVRGRTLLILVSNIQQYYGGLFEIAPAAKVDDGLLDVFVFKGLGFQYTVRHLLKVLSQRYLQDPQIVHRQAKQIEVLTEYALPIQTDGDVVGNTPAALKVAPLALRILVPPSAPPGLFTTTT
jgi:diacylglycerol kinase (ATP)